MFHKRLLNEFNDLKGKVIGMVLSQWIMMLANIIMVYVLADFMQKLLSRSAAHKEAGMYMCIVVMTMIVRYICTIINTKISVNTSTAVKERMRKKIFEKLTSLGSEYKDNIKTSEVVQFTTEGVEQLEIYFGKYVPQFFYSMLAPLTLFIITAFVDFKVAIVLLIGVPLIPASIIVVQKFAKKMLAKYWGTYTQMGDSFLECLQGLTTLKIYNADEYYAGKMNEEAESFRKVTMKVLIMQLNSISIMDLVAYGGAGIGIILSVLELNAGSITFAKGFFIIMIAAEFFLPMRLLGSFFHIAMNGNAAADKIFMLLDQPEHSDKESHTEKGMRKDIKNNIKNDIKKDIKNDIKKDTGSDSDTHVSLNVKVHDVSFSYDEETEVLNSVSMKLSTGMTALVGVSGCGKSTITSLLMKKNEPASGRITINGINISEYKDTELYKLITKIGHDAYIFAGTVRSNLLMGNPNATDEEMLAALEKVNMSEYVQKSGGLDSPVLERGSNLSGGQKQRVAVARAILHDTPVYIFDEATSNVDAESEDDIMQVIRELAKSKTIILISHRLANVVGADNIYVMDSGRIIEQGTHGQLVAGRADKSKNPDSITYEELYTQQSKLENYAKELAFNE